jgi:hypothetical protein
MVSGASYHGGCKILVVLLRRRELFYEFIGRAVGHVVWLNTMVSFILVLGSYFTGGWASWFQRNEIWCPHVCAPCMCCYGSTACEVAVSRERDKAIIPNWRWMNNKGDNKIPTLY